MSGGTLLDLNGGNATLGGLAGAGTIDNVNSPAAAPTLIVGNDNNSNTFAGTIQNTTGTVSLTKLGNGTQTLTGVNTFSGGTTISAGLLKVTNTTGPDLGSGTITDNSGNGLQLGNGVTISNAIVTGSNLEFEDVPDANATATISGAVSVAGSSQYRVGTTGTNSTLVLTGANTSGGTGAIMIVTRGNVVLAGNGSMVNNDTTSPLVIGRQTATSTLSMVLQNSATMTSVDGVVLSGINGTSDDDSVSLTLLGNSSIAAGGAFNLNDSEDNGALEIDSTVNVTLGGSSNLSTTNFTFGNLADSNATNVNIQGGTITATASDPAGSQFFPWFNNPNLPITPGFAVNIGAGGATINNGGFSITIAQQLGDGGGGAADTLTLAGTGTTVLANSNSYSGNTILNAGTLTVANSPGSSATGSGNVILNGGTLASASATVINTLSNDATFSVPAGNGYISGNVIAGSGAHTIAPGDVGSIGTLQIGGLTTSSLTTLNFDLGSGSGTITNGDLLVLGSGTVSIANGTLITFGGTPVAGNDYQLIGDISQTGSVVGAIPLSHFVLPTAPAGLSYSLALNNDFIDLDVTSVPSVSWNDASGNNLWDVSTSNNWNNGSSTTTYSNGEVVTFGDVGHYGVTLNSTVSPGPIVVNNSSGNYAITGTGAIVGKPSLTKSGTGTITIGTANTSLGAVSITNGVVQLGTSSGLATMTSLSIGASGKFDVNNNHIIINYGSGADPIASIAALLATGYNGGAWNGVGGIVTSAPLVVGGLTYGIGYADAADSQDLATGLAPGTIEVKYTLLGDADLNGIVNGIDFGILAANFNKGVTGWDEGDFDYNNIVNGLDFGDLAANFNKGAAGADVTGAEQGDFAALEAFAAANGLLADVPEPASIGLLAAGTIGILARRRRRLHN